MDKEELLAFVDGIKYRIEGILEDIRRFKKRLEEE